jgi:hypothetical protein
MRTASFLKQLTAALALLIVACGGADGATELSEGEVRLLVSAPEFSHLLPSRPIEQFDTMRTGLWNSPVGRVSGLSGSCWPKEGSSYASVPKRAGVLEMMREGTPIPYSWTSDHGMCGSAGSSCVLVGRDGVDPRCRPDIHSAALIATQSNEFYAILLNVYSFEPAVGSVTSIQMDGNRADVDFTIRWEPASLYSIILEEIGDMGRIDRDRATNPWLQPQTVRVFFHYYDELKPEKEWQGWRIVGARPH